MRLLPLILTTLFLTSCGYSGDLYLPEEKTEAWEKTHPPVEKNAPQPKPPFEELSGDRLE